MDTYINVRDEELNNLEHRNNDKSEDITEVKEIHESKDIIIENKPSSSKHFTRNYLKVTHGLSYGIEISKV